MTALKTRTAFSRQMTLRSKVITDARRGGFVLQDKLEKEYDVDEQFRQVKRCDPPSRLH
jgi:hypothetical protein